jgi:hypothetical protein
MPNFCLAATLKKTPNTSSENKEPRDEAKKQLESCPLRVEELDQPGHLLIKVTGLQA